MHPVRDARRDGGPMSLCACGCGRQTALARQTDRRRGWVRGQPRAYALGHCGKAGKARRYVMRLVDGVRKYEHILVVEKALGHPLPEGAEVHHLNGRGSDNRPENLVACQDHAYHELLHLRQRALAGGGDASFRRCSVCGTWDDPKLLRFKGRVASHRQPCARLAGDEDTRAMQGRK